MIDNITTHLLIAIPTEVKFDQPVSVIQIDYVFLNFYACYL